jgi:hypothetical protein
MWALDDVFVREGRTIDGLSILAQATNLRSDERLAARLAQITAGKPVNLHTLMPAPGTHHDRNGTVR